MLQQIPSCVRAEAADTLYFEAQCRIEDPVYGCVRIISQLHQQIHNAEIELSRVGALIAFHRFQTPQVRPLPSDVLLPSQSSIGQFQFSPSSQNPWFN